MPKAKHLLLHLSAILTGSELHSVLQSAVTPRAWVHTDRLPGGQADRQEDGSTTGETEKNYTGKHRKSLGHTCIGRATSGAGMPDKRHRSVWKASVDSAE